jgi:hypothetical protein
LSPLIFKTADDHGYDVEIANVGVLGAFGKGGIPVERAAETLHHLQDEEGKPLSGKKLEDAARDFAEARGLKTRTIKNLDEDAEERLRVEAGAFPRGKSAREISEEYGAQARAQLEAHREGDAPLTPEDLPPQATQTFPENPPKEA